MTIYDALPKEQLPNGVETTYAIGNIELDFAADSPRFAELTAGYEVPLSEEAYQQLLAKSPPGWRQAFQILREQGAI